MSVELISGRFDPPHLGHLITIGRELALYGGVIVVVLDDGNQHYPCEYRRTILTEACNMLSAGSRAIIDSHKTHFGAITRQELDRWIFDVYGGGNMNVIRHIDSLGIPCHWIPRAYDYLATHERLGRQVEQLLR